MIKLKTRKCSNGFSLVEMLVVITVFSVLAIVATQSLSITFKGSNKSDSSAAVRDSLRHALSVIERQLYNAKSVTCGTNTITYKDEFGTSPDPQFTWDISAPSPRRISSGSASLVPLTTDEVDITKFDVVCIKGARPELPDTVEITVWGVAFEVQGAEGAEVSTTSRILLRSY